MKFTPHQFNAFAHVVREGSFSSAARKLGVTQSAITQHVAKLETAIGSKLLARTAHGLTVTHAGRDLLDLAERYSALTQEIEERIAGYTNFETGHLSIIANAPQPALATIARYTRLYPDVEINFTLFDWTTVTAMLSDHSVDIAFVTRPRQTKDCVYKKLCDTRYVLYVPGAHRFADRDHVSLTELGQETVLLPERGSLTQKVVSEAFARHAVVPRRRVTTTTFPVMKEAILHEVGVGIFLSNAAAAHDRVAQIPITELPDPFEIYAAVPRHKFGLRLIRSFWDELTIDGPPAG